MSVTITHSTPTVQYNITTTAVGSAIIPSSAVTDVIEPSPNNLYEYSAVGTSVAANIINADAIASLSDIGTSATLQVNVGIAAHSQFQNELQGFKVLYKGFEADVSSFSFGDVCYFQETSNSVPYSVYLRSADVIQQLYGQSQLFVFLSYQNGNLLLMRKGYIDYPTTSTSITNWKAGKMLYIDKDDKFNTEVSYTSGNYVRSVGFCVPNKDGVYRIWFESDNTFVRVT